MRLRTAIMLALLALPLAACHVLPREARLSASNVPYEEVTENIDSHIGKSFIWGGTIIKTRQYPDGSVMEVLQNPLDSYGAILEPDMSAGRFLVFKNSGLDPEIFRKGRYVTIYGTLTERRKAKLDERDYDYPVLEAREIYLWREEYHGPPPYIHFGYFYPYPDPNIPFDYPYALHPPAPMPPPPYPPPPRR